MKWLVHDPKKALKTALLIVPVFESIAVPKLPKELSSIAPTLELLWKRKELSGKKGELVSIPLHDVSIERVMVVGLGPTKELSDRNLQNALGAAFKNVGSKPIDECALFVPAIPRRTPRVLASLLGIATHRALYHFKQYKGTRVEQKQTAKKPEDPKHEIQSIALVGIATREIKSWISTLGEIETLAPFLKAQRDWGNMPANECTPEFLATKSLERAKTIKGLVVTVLDKQQIKDHKMGGIYAVSRGAFEHPRFIIAEYWGNNKKTKPFVFVGKGITFDSGGISLKPGDKMHEMKFDMLGAASVINAVSAIAALKLPVNVVALAPCTENIPGAEAYKPGDVIKTMDGSTIEVLNTDAEGRVILSDALSYAHRYQPSAVIDLATLTGAAVVVLGHEGTPMVGNNEGVMEMLQKASLLTQDRLWPLPLWEEYKEAVKSDVADLRNITDGFGAGTITAAAFLEHFARPLPWAHLDIAGTGWNTGPKPWMIAGATDIGVQLLVEVAKQWKPIARPKS